MAAARFAVILLMASLFVDTSVAVTYTSKLVHRFSDEAKSFWASRNGNVSWPKQRSVDFFRLLLSSDAKRQRLKIGSKNQLLVPSEGSETMFFGNDLGWLHYTWIDIGTPNMSFLVALDAGSDLLWVPCDCIQCAPLSSFYNMLDRDPSEYIPLVSNTSKRLSCSHHLCELSPTCKSPKEPCPYNVTYYSVNTSSSGFLFEDKLQLALVGDYVSQSSVQASVIIGCGRKQSGSYLDGAAPDGVMGLGPGDISVPSLLAKAGLIQNSFSLCIDETYSGRIVFGDQGLATQQSTLFLPSEGKYITYLVEVKYYCIGSSCLKQTGFQALVDSGTSFTYLPHEIYEKVVQEFDKRVDARRSGIEEFPYCYEASSQDSLNIPSMELMFAMNQSFVIENPMFQITNNQEATLLCLGIHPTDEVIGIIGQNLMTGYRMVFDRENLKLGWSHSNCQDISDSKRVHLAPPPNDILPNPLPTNEQQNKPSTHAIAPAVAERTSSKPSASNVLTHSWLCLVCLLPLLVSLHSGYLL
ncbi:aspartic proteinase-like protein 1 [Actinidia eriantha]|uniref:aspartic proteinase-like protein 1 n=1 Tax=Actinidia eriantha TaxID=165200 RepID=UPI0025900419|nr:aspartic proteinase-like protein 1 [Actinidia eriantha]